MNYLYNLLGSNKYEDYLIKFLRLSIALIFIWFGFLKILGFNPVFELIYNSMLPWFSGGVGLLTLGILECVIGILLLVNRYILITHAILLLHLLGTFSTFIFGLHVVFHPYFPILSLEGEFVIKNMTLAISGLVVLVHEYKLKKNSI
jgi:uncharacterized membrane protein YkgB